LADWTVFSQDDPQSHLGNDFFEVLADLLEPNQEGYKHPGLWKNIREWDANGRLMWDRMPGKWPEEFKNKIQPAKLSMVDWWKEYLKDELKDHLSYVPGATFGVSRQKINSKPKEFYGRLLHTVSLHQHPEEMHYVERAWHTIWQPER
jgi:hypothetical protein